jgi:hypothetical protein
MVVRTYPAGDCRNRSAGGRNVGRADVHFEERGIMLLLWGWNNPISPGARGLSEADLVGSGGSNWGRKY